MTNGLPMNVLRRNDDPIVTNARVKKNQTKTARCLLLNTIIWMQKYNLPNPLQFSLGRLRN
jgi:hypothetical protein